MSQENKYREHPRKPTKRPYVAPVELAISPLWTLVIAPQYSPVYPGCVRLSFTGDDPRKPFVVRLDAGEVRRVIEALQAVEVAL